MQKIAIFSVMRLIQFITVIYIWSNDFLKKSDLTVLFSFQPKYLRTKEKNSWQVQNIVCVCAGWRAEEFGYEVSRYRSATKTPSYTVLTLETLKHKFPNDMLYFITGEDMFLSLLTWNNPERISNWQPFVLRSIEGNEKWNNTLKF